MNIQTSWLVVATVLVFALFAGLYATNSPDSRMGEQGVSIETCESLPDYDYEQIASRVEQIKGTQLNRNLSICVEQMTDGIDTTSSQSQFARVEESGLRFFGLEPAIDSPRRSSLGHTTFSPSGGPIEIYLANKSVVENVSWISYEGLIAHELSDATTIPKTADSDPTANKTATTPQTTDEILARQSLANGVSMYVADLYIEQHGGHLNVSALNANEQNWKRQVVQSAYSSGYRYSEQTDQRTVPETGWPNSTAQILHPNETMNVTGFPARPNLSINSLEHVQTDRIGELFLREAFRSKGIRAERAASAADGWTNDRMDYYRVNGSTVITWRIKWQNMDEMAEFIETYDETDDYERVETPDSIDCEKSGRYLTTSRNTVTILQCQV